MMKKYLFLLVLPFLFTFNVNALGISSANTGSVSEVIDNLDTEVQHNVSGGQWANWGTGYLYFDFSLMKVDGTSTSSNVFPRSATATSGGISYICSLGSSTTTNSTFNNMVFSAKCPMVMVSDGLTNISVQFQSFQSNSPSQYRFLMGGLKTFEQVADNNFSVDTSGTTSAINNQIANDNQNTQDIIDSQEELTQDVIDSQMSCTDYDKTSIFFDNHYLGSTGGEPSNSDYGITNYLKINKISKITITQDVHQGIYMCFYNINKTLISCQNEYLVTGSVTIPNDSAYVRLSIHKLTDRPQFSICKNGNQAIVDSQQEINNTLNNDDVTESSSTANSFFGNFQSNSHGISGIVSAPLRLIQGLSTSSCSSLSIPLPFVNNNATIPCMSTIYSLYPTFLSLWQLITTGLIGYWICVKLFSKIKDFQNPNNDKVEVLNL